ncbi:MAG: GTP-binding protein [Ruminococcus sp.]|nr:MAG: GTP-binding protein [Ruminococcus sp.]
MKDYHAADIRNIAIAGHSGSGKTTLAEALIYKSRRFRPSWKDCRRHNSMRL